MSVSDRWRCDEDFPPHGPPVSTTRYTLAPRLRHLRAADTAASAFPRVLAACMRSCEAWIGAAERAIDDTHRVMAAPIPAPAVSATALRSMPEAATILVVALTILAVCSLLHTTVRVPIFTAPGASGRPADQNIDQLPAARGGFGRSSAPGLPRARARLPVRCARAAATALSLSWPSARRRRWLAGRARAMHYAWIACRQPGAACKTQSCDASMHGQAASCTTVDTATSS